MFALLCFVLAVLVSPFKSKSRLEAENAALRHQLSVLQRELPGRVWLTNNDRWFFVQLYRWCLPILQVLTIVRPETLVHWHRAGIEMPPAVRFRPRVPQLLRDRRTKLQDPTADDVQASRGQQILDVAVAPGEP